MAAVDTSLIELDRSSDVAEVRLNQPDKLNALNPEMVQGLHDAFSALSDERGTPVMLAGNGRVTCAGMDTDIVSGDYQGEHGDLNDVLQEVYDLIETHPGPVAMAGKGAVVGAASLLAFSCELTYLGEETTFAIPEVKYGITATRATQQLPDLVGRHVAAELLLTGDELEPERARDLGIANDVVPDDEVEDHTRDVLATIAEHDDEIVAELIDGLAPDWGDT
ncbi:enoyl-CoA hydratase/isomerase family protein [Salinadaptatus halalkaliphilus]|uniref:Enoyl-CoA hydratase/isomerase family protein n=1 Tax=Salinadaptatus halalkaliphilus TaxID=2419781 RepID=A0A4V3VLN7_9EURY|nr:enoyl-CoA hydratase/isomerase family protein [Salinadaptatus halalkaliphilus]THE66327.1 enoyl-CoA hydratase/isomerase family protein [Salinadaptatus halalkaliphilus]